jgi:hypothetical protein
MRRGLGRGRLLVGVGAIIVLVAMPLDWFKAGGQVLTAITGNGLEGAGILIFVASIALLAVLTLPYASRDGRSSLDRPITYLMLTGAAAVGLVIRVVQLWSSDPPLLGLPDRAPGLWLGAAGVIVLCWGVAEILAEPAPLT